MSPISCRERHVSFILKRNTCLLYPEEKDMSPISCRQRHVSYILQRKTCILDPEEKDKGDDADEKNGDSKATADNTADTETQVKEEQNNDDNDKSVNDEKVNVCNTLRSSLDNKANYNC